MEGGAPAGGKGYYTDPNFRKGEPEEVRWHGLMDEALDPCMGIEWPRVGPCDCMTQTALPTSAPALHHV